MGKGSVTFKDGTVFNLEENFPEARKVALSMSGGVESTLLVSILAERYGAENVLVFSGEYKGRRWWESSHPAAICKQLGIPAHIPVPQTNHHMSPSDNWAMYARAKQLYNFDIWYNGTNAKLFSGRNVTERSVVERIEKQGYRVPFVWLEKWQTIELYYLLDRSELLKLSHSCTERPPEQGHCGKCYCCHERAWGFHTLGKNDPTTYCIPYDQVISDAREVIGETV